MLPSLRNEGMIPCCIAPYNSATCGQNSSDMASSTLPHCGQMGKLLPTLIGNDLGYSPPRPLPTATGSVFAPVFGFAYPSFKR